MGYKILFSNIGYARGIDGTLKQHVLRFWRHFYCSIPLQQEVLGQLRGIMDENRPDICCFVEIDEGSPHSGYFNQVRYLLDGDYTFHDSAGKYGPNDWLARLPLHIGKVSAFMAREKLEYGRLYFSNGSKRLIHAVQLPGSVTLYFTHFSLQGSVRALQFKEMREIVTNSGRPAIIMADFNILNGFGELSPLLDGTDLRLLNNENEHTFTLHTRRHVLDLCIASAGIADKMKLQVIPQPFSDHAALLAEINW